MEITQYQEHELRPVQFIGIMRLVYTTWPSPDTSPERLAEQAQNRQKAGETLGRRRFVVWQDTRAIAHAEIFLRTITCESSDLTITGLASVCVDQSYRGSGLGKAIVKQAFAEADKSGHPVLLFQTGIVEFYSKLGAREVSNRFYNSKNVENPDANPWWEPAVMIYPADCDFPQGDIDLNGPGY